MNGRKLLFLVAEDWYFWSHRLPIAQESMRRGYEVLVATRVDRYGERIRAEGFRLLPLKMERRSKNIWKELSAIREIVGIYRRERPDIVHHVAMKPVLYGSIAAWIVGIRCVVNAMAGLGYVFISDQITARLLRPFICLGFRILMNHGCSRLILQNGDDREFLLRHRLVKNELIRLIRGSGVDTSEFRPTLEKDGIPVIMLASRMLWDKGVGEFVGAARMLKERGARARFVLAGDSDPANPNSIPNSALQEWGRDDVVEWWGKRDDMAEVFSGVSIFSLPSAYGEGVPKVLLEAAACGIPIVTTDAPGCREVVRHGENGLLVPIKSTVELADALQYLIENLEIRRRMGARGREIVLKEFSVEMVVAETLVVYEELLTQ